MNKIKFLYFGDLHLRNDQPKSRKDNYAETLDNKVKEILELANKHDVAAILQGGDFLDKAILPNEYLLHILQLFGCVNSNELVAELNDKDMTIEDVRNKLSNRKPLLGVIGNHELIGNSRVTYERTSLAFLEQIGFMSIVSKEKPAFFKLPSGKKVAITGGNFHKNIDSTPSREDYVVEQKIADIQIHLVHGMATTENFGTLFAHTNLNSIVHTKADLTICGHEHCGCQTVTKDGKVLMNPGAPVRLSNDKKEMARTPQVVLIEIEDGETPKLSYKLIPLKSAKPSLDVLERVDAEQALSKKERIDEIKKIVSEASEKHGDTIEEIVEEVADSQTNEEAIKDEINKRFAEKTRAVVQHSKTPNSYKIRQLTLTNFQSHAFTQIEFHDGLNVFVGESRNGKSSMFRAMRWIYTNYRKNCRKFIKHGENFASARIDLSNGYSIERKVERKASGFNGYIVTYPDGRTEELNTKSLSLVQEILGFTQLGIDTQKTFPINFMEQGADWFFIGPSTTSPERSKLIGTIFNTHVSDAIIKDLEQDHRKLTSILKDKEESLKATEEEYECMQHVEPLQEHIKKVEETISNYEAVNSRLNELIRHREQLLRYKKEIEYFEKVVNDLTDIKDALAINSKATEALFKQKMLISHRNTLDNIMKSGKALRAFLDGMPKFADAKSELEKIKQLHVQSQNIQAHVKAAKQYRQEIYNNKALLCELEPIKKEANHSNELLKTLLETKKDLVLKQRMVHVANQSIEIAKNSIVKEEAEIKQYQKETRDVKIEYMNTFGELDVCPLCLQPVDKDVAIKIAKEKFN